MNLLLDTHTFLWLVEGNSNLSATATAALADPRNDLFLSVASVWELAIKTGNGKLSLSEPLDEFVKKWTTTYQVEELPILTAHALGVISLPAHHRDPFDRLLIAQTQIESMTLVSGDGKFSAYGAPILW
jgi:PIN domain nuclease of toxin-antitoxin system